MNNNPDICQKLSVNRWFIFILFFSFGAILFSFLVEYLGDSPCTLCLWQRSVYLGVFCTALFGFFHENKRWALSIIGLLFLINLVLSTYHLAIQMGIANDFCKVPSVKRIEEFHQLLRTRPSCSKIGWSFFGFPLSGFNAASSFVILLFLRFKKRRLF